MLIASKGFAFEVPPLTSHVNDRAGLLEPDDRARLDAKLASYEQRTGQQLVLLVVASLNGDALENAAVEVYNTWKLGARGKDDGLLMLVVTEDRRVKIEVGDGLEGSVTDALAGRVIRNVITPAFRERDYVGGIDRAFDALMTAASGSAPALPEAQPQHVRRVRRTGSPAILAFIVIFILLSSLGRRRRGGAGLWMLGGFLGGGGGGFFGGGGGGGGGFSGGGGRSSGGGASGGW